MKVYIAVLHDVHSDAIVVPYFNRSEATAHAKEWAKSHCRDQKSLKETFEHPNGYLYFAQYSGCGDRVWVTEHEVETEEEKRFRPGCNPTDPLLFSEISEGRISINAVFSVYDQYRVGFIYYRHSNLYGASVLYRCADIGSFENQKLSLVKRAARDRIEQHINLLSQGAKENK